VNWGALAQQWIAMKGTDANEPFKKNDWPGKQLVLKIL